MTRPDTQALLSELARVKVLFQQHTVATILHGKPIPFANLPTETPAGEGRV